ncbi:MAG: ferrochelatase [Pseudomonadota bacterium]
MNSKLNKTAVVLFNLGGPDNLEAVRPFLFNLFNDPAILQIPNPFRTLLARVISWRRTPEAQKIYGAIGGKSPILENTQAQADALELALGDGFKVFVCMRYWHPMAKGVVTELQKYAPQRIVLLSLYPQYSTTTIESSLKDWYQNAALCFSKTPIDKIECYPTIAGLVDFFADEIKKAISKCEKLDKTPRILFSAHGLPQKIVDQGDPYQQQVEETVNAILASIGRSVDSQICYQSRVGPLQWLGPATDNEIIRAGKEGKSVILVPVSFVSEHSETLYELDIQYKALADQSGVPKFYRVATVGCTPAFINDLAGLVAPERGRVMEIRHA